MQRSGCYSQTPYQIDFPVGREIEIARPPRCSVVDDRGMRQGLDRVVQVHARAAPRRAADIAARTRSASMMNSGEP